MSVAAAIGLGALAPGIFARAQGYDYGAALCGITTTSSAVIVFFLFPQSFAATGIAAVSLCPVWMLYADPSRSAFVVVSAALGYLVAAISPQIIYLAVQILPGTASLVIVGVVTALLGLACAGQVGGAFALIGWSLALGMLAPGGSQVYAVLGCVLGAALISGRSRKGSLLLLILTPVIPIVLGDIS